MKITPPLKWHGGKSYLAGKIIALMPPRRSAEHPDGWVHYVEPFFGGGAVMLAMDPEGISEVANDISYHLMNFWSHLAMPEKFVELARWAQAVAFSELAWQAARDLLADWPILPVEDSPSAAGVRMEAAKSFFMHCRMSLAGRMKCFAPLSKTRTRRGMNEQASAWLGAVDGLPEVHARLRRVAVLCRPANVCVKGEDGPQTLFYLDPPYLPDTRESKKVYAYEMDERQHEAMLADLASIKGRFLLSGYHSEMYDDAAARFGWKCHEFPIPNQAAGGKMKRIMTECVWTNCSAHKDFPLPRAREVGTDGVQKDTAGEDGDTDHPRGDNDVPAARREGGEGQARVRRAGHAVVGRQPRRR